MPSDYFADPVLRRGGLVLKESLHRHQDPGCAEPALQGVVAAECFLKNPELIRRGSQTFNCPYIAALELHRQREAGAGRGSINKDRAGAANAVLTPDMSSCQSELMTQGIGRQEPGVDF